MTGHIVHASWTSQNYRCTNTELVQTHFCYKHNAIRLPGIQRAWRAWLKLNSENFLRLQGHSCVANRRIRHGCNYETENVLTVKMPTPEPLSATVNRRESLAHQSAGGRQVSRWDALHADVTQNLTRSSVAFIRIYAQWSHGGTL